MILKKFKLRDPEYKKYFIVLIYKDTRSLIKAADRYCKRSGSKQPNKGITGIVHGFEKYRINADGAEIRHDNIGIIRLAQNWLTTEIASHELIHAALHQYRVLYGSEREFEGSDFNADFGNSCGKEEENFAYIYGRLFRDFTKKMYRHGLWK